MTHTPASGSYRLALADKNYQETQDWKLVKNIGSFDLFPIRCWVLSIQCSAFIASFDLSPLAFAYSL